MKKNRNVHIQTSRFVRGIISPSYLAKGIYLVVSSKKTDPHPHPRPIM